MMIPPLVGNPYNGYIKSYYWIDELIPSGTNGSSDPSTDAMGQRDPTGISTQDLVMSEL